MAEVMLNAQHRESLQSLDKLATTTDEDNMSAVMMVDHHHHHHHPTNVMMNEEETLKLPHQQHHPSIVPPLAPTIMHSATSNNNNTNKRVTHDTRTVVIEIPNEAKRRKVSTSITTKQVIDAISTAIREEDRRDALSAAATAFDHNLTSLHDEELSLGADTILIKHFGFLLSQKVIYSDALSMTSVAHETSCTMEALEMVLRASPTKVSESFSKFGRGLLAMLIHVINEEVADRNSSSIMGTTTTTTSSSSTTTTTSTTASNNSNTKTSANTSTVDPDAPPTTVVVESSPASSCGSNSPILPPAFPDNGLVASLLQTGGGTSGSSTSATPAPPPHSLREGDVLIRKATRILGHFARVGAATQPMAYFPGLLPCLVGLLLGNTNSNGTTTTTPNMIPPEVCLNSLWILANLACNSENMVMMACQPQLVPALVTMASREISTCSSSDSNDQHQHHHIPSPEMAVDVFRSQSIASRALVNLSWAPQNRIPLSENSDLLKALANLSIQRGSPFYNNSRTIQELIRSSRRHAVGTLRNLASAVGRRCKLQLCQYENGLLLDRLTDAALNDPDEENVKTKAFGCILHLAHQDTAELMVGRPALVLALKDALLSSSSSNTSNSNAERNADASKALRVLERSILPHMDSYSTLKELLEEVHPSCASLVSGDDEESATPTSTPPLMSSSMNNSNTLLQPPRASMYVDEEGNAIPAEAL
eukprot:CAMPEP_0194039078 /NCGR_PEP_ID=MMETSP0009_2-20130614/11266_1 /TAXON_ID=210454 /ORGANISM="Grammatophora oceanica, Strain CCMP 410" /LENGTH=708 /DNA_ID=CAMNT_0038681807 /DNA_START=68 /DNA_END=2194 /DNA_ORIENTATION=-